LSNHALLNTAYGVAGGHLARTLSGAVTGALTRSTISSAARPLTTWLLPTLATSTAWAATTTNDYVETGKIDPWDTATAALFALGGSAAETALTRYRIHLQPETPPPTPRPEPMPVIGTRISRQRQTRHVLGGIGYQEGGYFLYGGDAQKVLDAYHAGQTRVIGLSRSGNLIVECDLVTGFNNNSGAHFLDQPTHVFLIKGTTSVSVVPTSPTKGQP